MKKLNLILLVLISNLSQAQNGNIVEKVPFAVHDSVWTSLKTTDAALAQKIKDNVITCVI